MTQKEFAERAVEILKVDQSIIGLAVAGSWLTNDLDEFSDLDLVLVSNEKIAGDKSRMLEYAGRLGQLLSGFTGEHVGEPRVLICLFDNPLLHVDIKFITLEEFADRIETPVILLDTGNQLQKMIEQSSAKFPYPDYQWIEDRFWTWIHYALQKIGRGELLEAFDFFSFIRMTVLGPLLHIRNGNLPRGVRKIESQLRAADLEKLLSTIPQYDKSSIMKSLRNSVNLYRELRSELFSEDVVLQLKSENKVMEYFEMLS